MKKQFFKQHLLYAIALITMNFIVPKAIAGTIETITVNAGSLYSSDWDSYTVYVSKCTESITITLHLTWWDDDTSYSLNGGEIVHPVENENVNFDLTLQPGENVFTVQAIYKEEVWNNYTLTVKRGLYDNVMYVMKNGEVVFQSSVSDIDNVTFDETPSDALIVQNNGDSPVDRILLNNIQQLSFSDENLLVETKSSNNETYSFCDFSKLLFGIGNTGINNLFTQSSFDVRVSFSPVGDLIVESPVALKSLTLFSVDGKMISTSHCNGVDTQCTIVLQNRVVGVYILRVVTEQCTVIKKVVNPLNK